MVNNKAKNRIKPNVFKALLDNFARWVSILREFLLIGLRSLARQKTRTILTSGAITIGVVLILIMVSLGIGVNDWLIQQISGQMDLSTIFVLSNQAATMPGARQVFKSDETTDSKTEESPKLTSKAVESLAQIPHVEDVTPVTMITVDAASLKEYESPIMSPSVIATRVKQGDSYIKDTLAGDPLRINENKNEIILTNMFLRSLGGFEGEDYASLIGKRVTLTIPTKIAPTGYFTTTIEADNVDFIVAAVVNIGLDDTQAIMNIDRATQLLAKAAQQTPKKFLEETGYFSVLVKTDSTETTEEVADVIKELGFVTSTTEDIITMVNDMLKVVQIALSSFGAVALVVATLGIANAMVMSIYERTTEIGIMKAIGASKGNIRLLFLVEAGLIGAVGGIAGWTIGYPLTILGNRLLSNYLENVGITDASGLFNIPLWLAGGAILFSILIATIAGIYPSQKAAKLDPIKAIRHE